jgi:hypothetical protein
MQFFEGLGLLDVEVKVGLKLRNESVHQIQVEHLRDLR